MRVFEAFNALLLAFAPSAIPALRLLGVALPEGADMPRRRVPPREDISAGRNPYLVWMEARGLDARTVARRMDFNDRATDIAEAWMVAKDIGYEPLPHKPLTPLQGDLRFKSLFLGMEESWASLRRDPRDIVLFCQAVDITPVDLVPFGALPPADILDAAILYNRQISCGFESVTQALVGWYQHHDVLGRKSDSTGILQVCEAMHERAGRRPIASDGSVADEMRKIQAVLCDAATYVRGYANSTKPLPFAVYSTVHDDLAMLPAFRHGEFGAGVTYEDTDKGQRRAACLAWLGALEAWLEKPETGEFIKAVATARSIKARNFGLKYGAPARALALGCP